MNMRMGMGLQSWTLDSERESAFELIDTNFNTVQSHTLDAEEILRQIKVIKDAKQNQEDYQTDREVEESNLQQIEISDEDDDSELKGGLLLSSELAADIKPITEVEVQRQAQQVISQTYNQGLGFEEQVDSNVIR